MTQGNHQADRLAQVGSVREILATFGSEEICRRMVRP
jgi:hypothetical protein